MTQTSTILRAIICEIAAVNFHSASDSPKVAESPIERILKKIFILDLPGKEHFESYMRHKWRMNLKPSTLEGSYHAVSSFLAFYASLGKSQLQDVVSSDIEAFVEHEQDRLLKVTTVRTRLHSLWAFIRYLIDQDIIDARILKRKIKLSVPEFLPRAIAPEDIRKLLGAIKETRDRALILVLLRTGMRIGELLGLKMRDLDIRERRIYIYEGEKNNLGRVVYLSDDALMALRLWLRKREPGKEYLFYSFGHTHVSYSTARRLFVSYLRASGLTNKGYTIHSLRHTFASELLNAGMRLECLQVLMGHHEMEMTRRYARLTDKSREEEYFHAMEIIEQGGIDGAY